MRSTNKKQEIKNYIISKSEQANITLLDNNDQLSDTSSHSSQLGHRTRRKVLIKNDKNLRFLIDTLKNPNSTYVTHEKSEILQGLEPEYLSAYKFFVSHTQQTRTTKDVLACQLLNYFKIPTAIYFNVLQDNNETEKDATHSNFSTYTISLDFLDKNHTFETFLSFGEYPEDLDSYLTSIDRLVDLLYTPKTPFIHLKDLKKINDKKQSLREEFAYNYLVRKMFLGDSDFASQNAGIITNKKTGDINLAPNFDLEFCIEPLYNQWMWSYKTPQDMRILTNQYPHVLDKFFKKAHELFSIDPESDKLIIDKIYDSTPLINDNNFETTKHILTENLKLLEKESILSI